MVDVPARRTLGRERRMGAGRGDGCAVFSWDPFMDQWTVELERLGSRPARVVARHVGRGVTGRAAQTDDRRPT